LSELGFDSGSLFWGEEVCPASFPPFVGKELGKDLYTRGVPPWMDVPQDR
jgi:hypothetical protein